jgi:hypothetical protein
MSNNDERRLREGRRLSNDNERLMDILSEARASLQRAERKAPPDVEQEIKHIRYRLGDVKSDLNEKKSEYVWMKAGAKHQLRTKSQDQYENRNNDGT